MPVALNLLTARQAFNSYTAHGLPYSDYVHRIAPGEIERWFVIAQDHIEASLQNVSSPGLGIDVEVAGATILLSEPGRDAILIDPGPLVSSIRLADSRPCAILLTHAHKDHIVGLSWVFSLCVDSRVVMSEVTYELLMDILLRDNQYALVERIKSNLYLLNSGENVELGQFIVSAYQAGHCVGGLAYYLRPHRAERGVMVVGEFSRREVGGIRHSIPGVNAHVLFIEAVNADQIDVPCGINEGNNVDFLQHLELAYLDSKTVVIACASLAEMQEVYRICAMHQRNGGIPAYPLVAGNLSGGLKRALDSLRTLEPWDVSVNYTDGFEPRAVNILTCSFDEQNKNGHFWNVYREHAEKDAFAWFFPRRYEDLKPARAELYDAHTHASLSEIVEMILVQHPAHLCLYAGGTRNSLVSKLMNRFRVSISDIAGGSGSFKL